MAFLEEFKHFKIQLEDIKSATDNFGKHKLIGRGGFGPVYKGEMSRFKEQGLVAFKRLDGKLGQGAAEFSKEIATLCRYTHENLISLLGFCNERDEKILVYEYASNGSLDRHISSATLTWRQRLKICLQAARALEYLHDPRGTHQRVLHCDIKSGNILLDHKWNAKLSDLGLSKMGPANQPHTFLISSAVGTIGYCDPMYMEKGFLTKESDVYSFGVVLFEVLCGRLCYKKMNNQQVQILVPLWKESYEQKKLEEIVFQDLITQDMDHVALKIFSDIAYRCLKRSREERPTMTDVVTELEIALESQEISEGKEQLIDYEEMTRTAEPPLNYRSKAELMIRLSKGVLLNNGNTWFSINMKGEHCEMISMAQCLNPLPTESNSYAFDTECNSRFPVGSYWSILESKFQTRIRTQFLSPQVTYTVNLVFKFKNELRPKIRNIGLNYKLKGETKTSIAYLVDEREDEWLMLELYQFTTDRRIVDLEILFNGCSQLFLGHLLIEGIEFCPLQKAVEDEVFEDDKVDMQPVSDSETNWDEKLPVDYEEIIKSSKDSIEWKTNKELYLILCNGFLMTNGQAWFSLDKNGKKCRMLSARAALVFKYSDWMSSSSDSRFGEAIVSKTWRFSIVSEIKTQVLSPETTYASYLIYKLPQDQSRYEAPVKVENKVVGSDDWKEADFWYIYLVTPRTPVIRPKADEKTHNPLSRPKIKGLPRLRTDGWMEVHLWEFRTTTTTEMIPMRLELIKTYGELTGIIIRGVDFRPI